MTIGGAVRNREGNETMSERPKRRPPKTCAIRTWADFEGRCYRDPDTGCLEWRMAMGKNGVPVCHMPPGTLGSPGKLSMGARRAGWLLAGLPLKPGQVVYLNRCDNPLCVEPKHCRAGLPGDPQRAAAKRGSFATPTRRAQVRANSARQAHPPEIVQTIAALIEEGVPAKYAGAMFGVHKETAEKIARGQHWHQRPNLITGASVFTLAGAGS